MSEGTALQEPGYFESNVQSRRRQGVGWRLVFQISTVIGIIVLSALLYNIINSSFGLAAVEFTIDPAALAIEGVPLEQLSKEQLTAIFQANVSAGLYRRYHSEIPFSERSQENVYELVLERVVEPQVQKTWTLVDSLFNRAEIEAEAAEKYPESHLEFISWIDPQFITSAQSSDPLRAGVRTAVLGTLWVVAITFLFSFPIGTGAAIYLQEFAADKLRK